MMSTVTPGQRTRDAFPEEVLMDNIGSGLVWARSTHLPKKKIVQCYSAVP